MRISKDAKLKVAFALDIVAIKRLAEVLAPSSSAKHCSVKLSDGSTVSPATLDELDRLPNADSRRIVSITMENKWEDRVRCRITLFAERNDFSITYSLEGEEANVVVLEHQLTDWAQTVKRGASWLYFSNRYTRNLSFTACVVGTLMFFFPLYFAPHTFMTPAAVENVGFAMAGLTFLLGWIRAKLYPGGLFTIGAGKHHFEHLQDLRKRLGVLSPLGLAVLVFGRLVISLLETAWHLILRP